MVIRTFFTLFSLIVLSVSSLFAQGGYQGTDFWVAFPQNARAENSSGLKLSIYISSSEDAEGIITEISTGKETSFKVKAGSAYMFSADSSNNIMASGIISRLAFHITTNSDVNVIVLSHRLASTDSYAAIPSKSFGTEYLVCGYDAFSGSSFTTQFDIIAKENDTKVEITCPKHSSFERETIVITLNKGEVYHRNSSDKQEYNRDLTGTIIQASKPVGFITGSSCAQVPKDKNFCDMLMEMAPPTSTLGTEFIVAGLPERTVSSLRVVATKPDTKVIINDVLMATLSEGTYYQNDELRGTNVVQTSAPAYVYQYAQSAAGVEQFSDPFMMYIPSTNQYTHTITITIPELGHSYSLPLRRDPSDFKEVLLEEIPEGWQVKYIIRDSIIYVTKTIINGVERIKRTALFFPQNGQAQFAKSKFNPSDEWHHWISIVTEAPSLSNVIINGKPIEAASMIQVFTSRYFVAFVRVSPGVCTIQSDRPATVFSIGYGTGGTNYDSYGHNCGMNLFIEGQ